MFPPNTWVFDLEILRAIPDKNQPPLPGILYCKHWGDHAAMGISVLCCSRPDGSEMKTYIGDPFVPVNTLGAPLMDFYSLALNADLLVGYGSVNFDAKVLGARGIHLRPARHIDFLREVKKAVHNQAPKGWKLTDAAERIGFPPKSFDGAMAPIDWQRGNHARVIEYCQTDVLRTCALAAYYAANSCSLPAPDGGRVYLRSIPEIYSDP